MTSQRGLSSIIAMLLMISMAVVGSAVYYAAMTSYLRPHTGLSSQVSISAGASGFAVISAQVVDTGGIPFSSLKVSVTTPSSQLEVLYGSLLSANGGSADFAVRGVSGGPYVAMSSGTTVSGNLQVDTGSAYVVTVTGTMPSGATYSQAFSVRATP
jgi:hypothetical protein